MAKAIQTFKAKKTPKKNLFVFVWQEQYSIMCAVNEEGDKYYSQICLEECQY